MPLSFAETVYPALLQIDDLSIEVEAIWTQITGVYVLVRAATGKPTVTACISAI
jgi:hypothetical protein